MVGLVGLAGLFAWAAVARTFGMIGPLAALTALVACGVPMVLWSLLVDKVHRNPIDRHRLGRAAAAAHGDARHQPRQDRRPVGDLGGHRLRSIASAAGIGTGNYLFSMQVLGVAAVPLLVLSMPYVLWLDRRLKEPRDGAWHFGQLLIGRADLADRARAPRFLPRLGGQGLLPRLHDLDRARQLVATRSRPTRPRSPPIRSTSPCWLISVMFMIDVTFATVGYVLTMKPLDAHIRTANPYAAGWAAALICYPPFILMGDGGPLDYHTGTPGRTAGPTGSPTIRC